MSEPADAPQEVEDDGYRNRFLPIASWVMYDFANTIFAGMVVTLAMPKILGSETGRNTPMASAVALALVLSAVAGPFLGALADATGSTLKQVVIWTTVCCLGSASLSLVPTGDWVWLYVIFVLSYVAYNVSISLYDAFLPDICTDDRMGFVSGVGVGIGYLGALLGYFVADRMIVHDIPFYWTLAAAGGLMFVFSLPMFLFVRERSGTEKRKFTMALGFEELKQAHRTITSLPKKPAIFLFLLGNLLAVDSLNAMTQWVARFFEEGWGADSRRVIEMLVGLSIAGTIFGIVAGKLADIWSARGVLLLAVVALLVVSLADSLGASFGLPLEAALWITTIGGGLGAAGVWLAGRRVLVDIAPREQLGEYMGLLGITRKASIFGTLLLATLADTSGWKVAVGALSVPLAAGYIVLTLSNRAALRAEAEAAASA